MNDKITVCLGKGGQREMAESFARKNNVPIMDKPGEHLTVMFDSRGVSLTGYGLTYQGDFEGMLHRVTNGRLSHEMLVRAVKTEGEHLKAIDATAGMGEDGFLLASYGYEVTLYEQNPVIAALLKDALDPNLVQTLEHNPAIIHGGPFANIAHGCNSAIATRLSLKLAETVLSILDDSAEVQYTYELDAPLTDKIEAVATKIYRAGRVSYTAAAKKTLDELTALGYGKLPVYIAKTQYSFSDNAKLTGAPEGHTLNVREVRLSAGAGFVVVVCGSIMTMPGLPKHPAAMDIDVDVNGKITGLF